MEADQHVFNDFSADEMFLDDAVEVLRPAVGIPGPLGVDHGDRPTVADPQAVGLGSLDASLFGEAKLLEPALEMVPGLEGFIPPAALGLGLVAAEKDVPPGAGNPQLLHDVLLLSDRVAVLRHFSFPGLWIPCLRSRETRVLRLRTSARRPAAERFQAAFSTSWSR